MSDTNFLWFQLTSKMWASVHSPVNLHVQTCSIKTPASHCHTESFFSYWWVNCMSQRTVNRFQSSKMSLTRNGHWQFCRAFFSLDTHCTVNPFVASAAVLIASLLEVTQWQGLDPSSLWGTAPLPNPPPLAARVVLLARSPGWPLAHFFLLHLLLPLGS